MRKYTYIFYRYTFKEVPPVYGIGINGTYTGSVGILNRKVDFNFIKNVEVFTSSECYC